MNKIKSLYKKYTRTQGQRVAFVFIVFLLAMATLVLLLSPPLFFALAIMGSIVGVFAGIMYLIGTWVGKGDSY